VLLLNKSLDYFAYEGMHKQKWGKSSTTCLISLFLPLGGFFTSSIYTLQEAAHMKSDIAHFQWFIFSLQSSFKYQFFIGVLNHKFGY